ncbi:MAG TPA: MotA/TolQ/ExbB proton channel family protein [Longimicrobiales bacterium]|nr:MotA/TolQ/ExbB proton channel family protein [Longimicrobiales bacterium]
MGSLTTLSLTLLQAIPGLEQTELTFTENVADIWKGGGFMMYPLGLCALLGLIIIVWKLFDLSTKSIRTGKFLREVDELIAQRRINDALALARDSNTPAGRILAAGLERHDEGSERVMKAIENVGLIEMAGLESGLVWLATVSNVAPLLGFLGTVIGMIQAFQAIEAAGEVEATLVAGGIKVALITTAAGLTIAIPINIAHNYFVTRIDRLVIDMEESAQKMVDALHERGRGTA